MNSFTDRLSAYVWATTHGLARPFVIIESTGTYFVRFI
jgi:hypothetical protein